MMIRATRHSSPVQINFLSLLLIYALWLSPLAPFTVRRVDGAVAGAGKSAASPTSTLARKARYREGELIIRFRQGTSDEDKNILVANKGARRERKLAGASRLEKLHLAAGGDPQSVAAELRQSPLVELAEPNYLVERDEIVPNDPQFTDQWALRNTGQNGGQAGADVSAALAWETTTGSTSTVIAVIDSGIDFTHPDLQNNQWTNLAEQANGVDDDHNGLIDDLHGWDWVAASNQIRDEQGHGTAMAGLIAAEGNNAVGTTGVMWRASLMSLRVLDRTGTGDVARAVEAIDYAVEKGAKVINCSWGTDGESTVLREAVERASERQVLIVSSAGNSGRDIDAVPYYPASFDLPNLISVAATNNLDQLIATSNRGATRVTVAAPGASVLTTKMNGGYYQVTGTSASTAVVTGVVGLLRTVRPLLGAADTKAAVINGTRQVTDLAGKVSAGGVVSASGALGVMQGPDVEPIVTPTPTPEATPSPSASPTPQGEGGGGNDSSGGSEAGETDPPGEHGAPGGNLHDLEAERNEQAVEPQAPELIHSDLCTTCEGNDDPPPGQTPNDPDVSQARTKPENETGQPGVDLGSRNYNWSVPILGLPGRAGLDLGLTLYYNSLVWTRQGSIIRYNADRSHPGSGFRLGWPTIQQKYKNAQGNDAYLLVMPSGARVEMESVGGSIYESMDSSYTEMTDNGPAGAVVRLSDGTRMTFLRTINVSGVNYPVPDGEMRCIQIMDRNGNFMIADYDSFARLSKITDTIGRVITFVYTSYGKLLYINQKLKNDATRRWATFTYDDRTIGTNFQDTTVPYLSVEGPQNGTVINVLSQVQLIDATRYTFDYTSWGQVWKISRLTPDGDPATTAYKLRSYTSYNLPLTNASPLDDCPRFTERKVWAQNWNGDRDGVPNSEGGVTSNEEALTKFSVASDDSWTEVITPDNTKYKEFFATSGWQKGLTTGTEVYVGTDRKKWTTTAWTQDDETLAYQKNPRVEEINLYDKEQNRRRTTITYSAYTLPSLTKCSFPKYVREFDSDATTVLRTTFYDYNMHANYTGGNNSPYRILGLVSSVIVYKGNITAPRASKVTYQYDETGGLVNEGNENSANGHETNRGANFQWRGNLTSVTRYDVEGTASVTSSTAYNTTGSVVSSTDPLGHKTSISYADKYYNSGNPAAPFNYNTWAYPTKVTDPDGYTSTAEYDFDYGVVERTTTPSSGTGSGVTYLEMVMTYDGVGRMTRATNKNNNAYARWVYDPSLMLVKSFQTVIAANKEAYAVQEVDGAGRVRGTAVEHPDVSGSTPLDGTNSKNRFSGQYIEYDKMGRLWRQSNPTEMDKNWVEAGDDATGGWRYTTQLYDWNGRPTITTNTDNSKRIVSYDGCGCAGGEVSTLTDERGRERKLTKDALGRLKQVEEMDFNGALYAKTTYTYDALDNLLTIVQGVDSATWRKRTFDYDGHGRLHSRTTPEQGTTIYTYKTDDTIEAIAAPSGRTTLSYNNNRHLVSGITYSNAATGIALPSSVTYSYDAAGNRTLMTDGRGRVDYHYNDLGQLTSEDRYFNELSTTDPFTLSYLYNLGGELTKITNEKWNVNVSYGYDVTGRINKVTGGGWANTTSYVNSMDYRAFGGLKTVKYGNTLSLDVTYDTRLSVKQWRVHNNKPVPENLFGWTYSYQFFGEKTGRVTFADSLVDPTQDRSYEYDHVGRLIKARTGSDARYHINPTTAPPGTGDGPYSQNYAYDQWGNLTANQGRGGISYSPYSGASFNNKNQQSGYVYDAAGNLKNNGSMAYEYDVNGQQVTATPTVGPSTGNLMNWYDGDGLKVKKVEREETVYYLRSSLLGGQVVTEMSPEWGTGVVKIRRGYVYIGGQLLALQDYSTSGAERVTWVHQDPVTKSQRFTDKEGTMLTEKVDLDPWGVETESVSNPEAHPRIFTTYERDMGGDDAMFRRYNSGRSRFDQPDPYDGSYNLADPQSFNRYVYVQNDPVNFVDPTGLETSLTCIIDGVPMPNCNLGLNLVNGGGAIIADLDGKALPPGFYGDGNILLTAGGFREVGTLSPFAQVYLIDPQNPAPGQRLSEADCEKRLAALFGGPGAVASTGREPSTLLHPNAGKSRFADHSAAPDGKGLGGIVHLYTNAQGTPATVGLYVPSDFSRSGGGVVRYPLNQTINPGQINYNYEQYSNSAGLMISFVHIANPGANRNDRNAAGSYRIGNIAGPGGTGAGYNHTHINFYFKGKRTDPRSHFCK